MARGLRMSAELSDWLAELRSSDPASATEVGAALVAVITADDPSGLPVVSRPAARPVDPREAVDYAYQDLLETTQQLRRHAAERASDRTQQARLLADAEAAGESDDVLAQQRLRLDEAVRSEREATQRSQRVQRELDAYRTAKETAKATYTAAEAILRIQSAMDAMTGDGALPDDDDGNAGRGEEIAAAEARLQAAAQALRELHDPGGSPTVAGLLELRADPLVTGARILFAAEPAGTVTLLAVLEDRQAAAEYQDHAIRLAGELLRDLREGGSPHDDGADDAAADPVTFTDTGAFLARYFPSSVAAISDRAAELAGATTLAALRRQRGLSLDDLARRSGLAATRLRRLEDGDLGPAELADVAAYIRALGGRLSMTAEFDGGQQVLI